MQLLIGKTLFFSELVRIDDVTPSLKSASAEKKQHARELWSMLAIFDVFGLSKIVNSKCTPIGLIITKVTLFSIECKAMKGGYNQDKIARISVSKVIRT